MVVVVAVVVVVVAVKIVKVMYMVKAGILTTSWIHLARKN